MTNKMPVVGKRYKEKTTEKEWEIVQFAKDTGTIWLESIYCRTFSNLENFWNRFEELSDSNSQETEEVQIEDWHIPRMNATYSEFGIVPKADEWVKCPYSPATPEFNTWFKERFNCCPITGKKLEKVNETLNPVDLEKKEVNEVEKALEELKKELSNKRDCHFTRIDKLENLARNLVTALESVKDMSKPELKIDHYVTGNITFPKIEHVEPVSIWKDVSELPEGDDLVPYLIKSKNGAITIGEFRHFDDVEEGVFFDHISQHDNNVEAEEIEQVIAYTTLTDFINSFEQMQKDIQQLKQK